MASDLKIELDFKLLFDMWSLPVNVMDRNLCFVYANDAYLEIVHQSREDLIGAYVFELFPEEPERQSHVEAKFLRALEGEQTTLDEVPYEIEDAHGERSTRYWQAVQDPLRANGTEVSHVVQRVEDVTDRVKLQNQNDRIATELDHRVKNLLTVISATAQLSGESADSVEQFVADFAMRLRSMDNTYSRLIDTSWTGISIRTLIDEELKVFNIDRGDRCKISGPPVKLSTKSTKDAAMILHELVTNAVKYGCFAVDGGSLSISWSREAEGLKVEWLEEGLSGLAPPTKLGFGTKLFALMPYLKVEREYRPTGLYIRFEIPGEITPEGFEFAGR